MDQRKALVGAASRNDLKSQLRHHRDKTRKPSGTPGLGPFVIETVQTQHSPSAFGDRSQAFCHRVPMTLANCPALEDAGASDAMDVAQLDPEPVERAPLASARDIRRLMIEQSLSSYFGSCPCPYNTDRAGRSCGRRSAYSRPGGAAPLCYPSDISDAQVRSFRDQQN